MLGRLLLLGFVACVFAGLYFVGFFAFIQKPEEVREAFRALGVWGPVLYVFSFALLEPFFVPGLAFMLPGAFVWEYPQLMLLSWIGATGAGITGFAFARYIGRDYVQRHLPTRMRRYDTWIAESGLRAVIVIRLIFFIAPPANWLFGLSRVSLPTFVLGTAIGFLPGIALLTYAFSILQETLFEWLEANTQYFLIGLVIAGAAYVVYRRIWERRVLAESAAAAHAEPGEEADPEQAERGASPK